MVDIAGVHSLDRVYKDKCTQTKLCHIENDQSTISQNGYGEWLQVLKIKLVINSVHIFC